MKITPDGNGKHIIDFEGLAIGFDIAGGCGVNELFNFGLVSGIHNGNFYNLNEPVCKAAFEEVSV